MDRLVSPKTKQVLLVVLAVALVALAGCNTGGDTTTSPGETLTDGNETLTTDTETTTEPTTTEPTTTEPTTTEPTESDIDPDVLASEHAAQVEAADSLAAGRTISVRSVSDGNLSTQYTEYLGYYNFQDSVGFENATETYSGVQGAFRSSSEVYTNGSETFQKVNSTRYPEAQYFYGQEPYNESELPTPVDFENAGWVSIYESLNGSFQSQGTTEYRGQTVEEYTADGQASLPNLSEDLSASFSEIDSLNATILVTEDSLVTYLGIQASGTGTDGSDLSLGYQFTVTDVNATTVEEPAWTSSVNTTG
ncbi:MAG: hypothetical protein V5A27_10330 [Halapricum sp.]